MHSPEFTSVAECNVAIGLPGEGDGDGFARVAVTG